MRCLGVTKGSVFPAHLLFLPFMPILLQCSYRKGLAELSLPWWLSSKESASNAGDADLISGLERSPGEGMATLSSTLAWRNPWTEEPGRLQSMGLQKVGHGWSDWACPHSLARLKFLPFYLMLGQKDTSSVGPQNKWQQQEMLPQSWENTFSLPLPFRREIHRQAAVVCVWAYGWAWCGRDFTQVPLMSQQLLPSLPHQPCPSPGLPHCLHGSLFYRQSNALSSLQWLGAGCRKNQAQLASSDSWSPAGTSVHRSNGPHRKHPEWSALLGITDKPHEIKTAFCSKFDFSISLGQLVAFPIWGKIQGVGCSQCQHYKDLGSKVGSATDT